MNQPSQDKPESTLKKVIKGIALLASLLLGLYNLFGP
jgi:hypothetical protein